MDRYGLHGELLAEQYDSLLGPFLVGPNVDRAYEIGLHETTVYEHGRTWTERTPRMSDECMKLTRNEYASCMADYFYGGFYHDFPEYFFIDVESLRTGIYRGDISIEWSLWLSWANGIVRQVMMDARINLDEVV